MNVTDDIPSIRIAFQYAGSHDERSVKEAESCNKPMAKVKSVRATVS